MHDAAMSRHGVMQAFLKLKHSRALNANMIKQSLHNPLLEYAFGMQAKVSIAWQTHKNNFRINYADTWLFNSALAQSR